MTTKRKKPQILLKKLPNKMSNFTKIVWSLPNDPNCCGFVSRNKKTAPPCSHSWTRRTRSQELINCRFRGFTAISRPVSKRTWVENGRQTHIDTAGIGKLKFNRYIFGLLHPFSSRVVSLLECFSKWRKAWRLEKHDCFTMALYIPQWGV